MSTLIGTRVVDNTAPYYCRLAPHMTVDYGIVNSITTRNGLVKVVKRVGQALRDTSIVLGLVALTIALGLFAYRYI